MACRKERIAEVNIVEVYQMNCLNCKHVYGWHGDCGHTLGKCEKCYCIGFAPSDNLLWIEYLADKRNLV
jgi:hypothetical protein